MTEQEWLTCKDPQEMIRFLTSSAKPRYDRKLVLFAIACCLRVKHLFDVDFLLTLEKVAWWAEHPKKISATRKDIEYVQACGWNQSSEVFPWTEQTGMLREVIGNPFRPLGKFAKCEACHGEGKLKHQIPSYDTGAVPFFSYDSYCKLCLGAGVINTWKRWLTTTVLSIAQQIYTTQDYAGMPILADAMEEAGCEVKEILEHLRGSNTHVWGCWALDLILGKE